MAINPLSTASSRFKLSGLATGFDTDQMVKDLIKAERVKVDKLYQKRQISEWKQEGYREITNDIRAIKDQYFNVIKPESNMLSQTNYRKFTTNSSDSSYVTATVTDASIATEGVASIRIATLAQAGTSSSNKVSEPLIGTETLDLAKVIALSGKNLQITLDGTTKEITLGDYSAFTEPTYLADFKAEFQSKINSAFGESSPGVSKIIVGDDGSNKISLTEGTGFTKISLASGSSNDALASLGFTSGDSNRISSLTTLSQISQYGGSGLTLSAQNELKVTINSQDYIFSGDDTLSEMLAQINSDTSSEVSAKYDQRLDKIILTARDTGKGTSIVVDDTDGNFFESFTFVQGKDAEIYYNGEASPIYSSKNSLDVNGITYNLLKTTGASTEDVTIAKDPDATYDNIKKFFDDYNAFIEKINGKIAEKYDKAYQPLSDEQKAAMSEPDIKIWESKAKQGLMKNDPILEKLVRELRNTFSDAITGTNGNVGDIGISTGYYTDKGKITIDETTLKNTIRDNPDKIMSFMSNISSSQPTYLRSLTSTELSTRYGEEGIMNRIADIVENNISTISNTGNMKGYLIVQAGIQSDSSEYNNTMNTQIEGYEDRINELNRKLAIKEENYYKKFAALEKAIARMNSQSNWLSSQLGGGSQQ